MRRRESTTTTATEPGRTLQGTADSKTLTLTRIKQPGLPHDDHRRQFAATHRRISSDGKPAVKVNYWPTCTWPADQVFASPTSLYRQRNTAVSPFQCAYIAIAPGNLLNTNVTHKQNYKQGSLINNMLLFYYCYLFIYFSSYHLINCWAIFKIDYKKKKKTMLD